MKKTMKKNIKRKAFNSYYLTILFFLACLGALTALLISEDSYAKDFGIEGHTYPIIEEDMLKVIAKRLEKIDMEQFNQKLADQTKQYVETPPAVRAISKAKQTREFFYDPTYVLQEDIKDHQGIIIHNKGTKINPLISTSLTQDLIFIDGDDNEQVELALKIREEKQNRLKIILIKGSPLKLQRKHKIWIYFDQAGFITQKLRISEVPALVEQDELKLKITIIGEQDLENKSSRNNKNYKTDVKRESNQNIQENRNNQESQSSESSKDNKKILRGNE